MLLGRPRKTRIKHSCKKLCLSGESSSFCSLGLLYRIVYPYSSSHREEQFGMRRGERKSGWHNKYPPLGNAFKRKFCFTLWSLFLLALTSSGTTLKKTKVFMEKSPLQTWCLKSRRVAQTRDPGHGWGEGQLVLIFNNSLKFYVSPMVFFVSVQKVPHSPQKRDLKKKPT